MDSAGSDNAMSSEQAESQEPPAEPDAASEETAKAEAPAAPPPRKAPKPRDLSSSDVERFLEVGMGAIFQSDPHDKNSPRFRTVLRGWETGGCLILDLSGFVDRTLMLRQHEPCLLRFLSEGRACALDCKVLDWRVNRQNPYFRVSWPEQVRYIIVRKDERLDVEIPVTLEESAGNEFSGQIEDISVKGFRAIVAKSVPIGIELGATFNLPDGCVVEKASYTVRNVSESGGRFTLGCEMTDEREETISDLHFFVLTAVSRLRASWGAMERVVAIGHTAPGFDNVETSATKQGFTVYRASGVMEGFCLMRLQPTCGVLLDAKTHELNPADICKVIRSTRGFKGIPILVYNVTPSDQAAITEAGGSKCYGGLDEGTVKKMVNALAELTIPPEE